jgi:hypothetical protein
VRPLGNEDDWSLMLRLAEKHIVERARAVTSAIVSFKFKANLKQNSKVRQYCSQLHPECTCGEARVVTVRTYSGPDVLRTTSHKRPIWTCRANHLNPSELSKSG